MRRFRLASHRQVADSDPSEAMRKAARESLASLSEIP